MQSIINNLIISVLNKEILHVQGFISLEDLQKEIQQVYTNLCNLNAGDITYVLIRDLTNRYNIEVYKDTSDL